MRTIKVTREEAIQYLQPIADSAHMKRYSEALSVAIAALREQDHFREVTKLPCDSCDYGGKHLEAPPCNMCPAHPKEPVTNRNGLNCIESEAIKVVESDQFDGCEYCRDSKDIYEIRSPLHDSYNTDVYISENSLVMDIGCHSYGTVAIKFCPMCGRRLEAT